MRLYVDVEVYRKRDVEKTPSFFTEDVVLVTPFNTFRGREEVKRSKII